MTIVPLSLSGLQEASSRAVDFERDIAPILKESCLDCHDSRRQRGGLRLDSRERVLLGGDHGPALVPGAPEQSLLIQRVSAVDEEERMPPIGDPLDAGSIALMRQWIEAGAPWSSSSEAARTESSHWAYHSPGTPAVPAVTQERWVKNPIDRFVLARLEQRGLKPSSEADRATLIRRASLDLIGLPPTESELHSFLQDQAPDAYERMIDRLLASPHYGERWARHWLDLARYADSHGFTIDGARSIWPYRDWVVRALNSDMPFDQFTIEQLAGDLLPDATLEQRVATGFHRNTMVNQEGGADDEEFRIAAVLDRVNTTATVWLGSTMACAQCHSHKYDPITQRDYYRFFAFFNQTEDGGVRVGPTIEVPTPAEAAEKRRIENELARLRRILQTPTPALASEQIAWERDAIANRGDWFVLRPQRYEASEGLKFESLADGSMKAVAPFPESATYAFELRLPVNGARSLRLEVLPDESMPRHGPGAANNGNFVLNEVRAEVRKANQRDAHGGLGAFEPIQLASARASHFQNLSKSSYWPIEKTIDGAPKTGWAILPRTGQAHVACFEFPPELELERGDELRVVLEQNYGNHHLIGRLRLAVSDRGEKWQPRVLPGEVFAALQNPAATRSPESRTTLAKFFQSIAPSLEAARARMQQLESERPRLSSTLVMREKAAPRKTHMLRRGNFLDPGEEVSPGVPEVLPPLTESSAVTHTDALPTRLDLAHWLVRPDHPLTQRVTVNRWWQRFFGTGLVETENDFGTRGARPSHPQLLDWLATEFVRRSYSMKAMHRLIVTSATYRQSSQARAELAEHDPRNRWLARQNRLRCDAETLRDSALTVSDLLSRKLGGKPVYPPQPDQVFLFTQTAKKWTESQGPDRYRRSLYTWIWRSSPYPFYSTFDGAEATVSCTRRNRSNTALQALTLANDPMMLELAQGLARRCLKMPGRSDEQRLAAAVQWCLMRAPTESEQQRLSAFLARQRLIYADQPDAAISLLSLEGWEPFDPVEAASWTSLARVLLNLDEFLTRG